MRGPGGAMTAGQARQLLGLPLGASAEALTRAYRVAVKAVHPDNGGDGERLRQVVEAHRVLQTLAQARLAFALTRRRPAAEAAPRSAPEPANVRPAQPVRLRLQISIAEAVLGGTRRVEAAAGRQLELTLPAGLGPGEVLRLRGAGGAGLDVLVTIGVAVEPGLQLRGRSLWLELAAPKAALKGGERVEIETPRGRRAFLVPKAAEGGGVVRLKGEGLPARGAHPAGDLIVRLTPEAEGDTRLSRRLLRRFSARWAA